MLFPPSLDEMIEENHPVFIVDQVIDKLDISPILEKYKGGGTSSYHPRMLLKVLIYAYINNIYSSRKIESALKENIHFMWLSGMSYPDHNTINRFRGDRLKGVLKEVFKQVVILLAEAGLLNIKELYVDGTKIEANANKYTFVWGKSIKTSQERIKKQVNELWDYAQSVAKEEMHSSKPDFTQIDAEKVTQTIEKINNALEGKKVDKKVKQKLNYAKKNWPSNLRKYEKQSKILGKRNSYSKTDQDATFMRMKDDHMQNGQLKPGYNLQIATNNQIIVNYTLHSNPTDTLTLKPHLLEYEALYGSTPETLVADSGYGSEENYELLEQKNIETFVKYNYFHKEQKQKKPDQNLLKADIFYNKEKDCCYCPMGQKMEKVEEVKRKTKSGYLQTYSIYQATNCKGCPLRTTCHKSQENRKIQRNHKLNKYKDKARSNLLSELGVKHRKKRPCDVEVVFGNLKQNHHFKRFMLRGNEKVNIETGLMAIAHNLRKMAA